MKQASIQYLWFLCVLFVGLHQPARAAPALRTGDRVVFLGDSITALGGGPDGYVSLVAAAITLRCPEMDIEYLANAGVPGDTAPGALKRLQTDVLDQKPTFVTICFGMNDARAAPHDDKTYDTFMTGMTGLVSALKSANIRVALITSSPVDPDRAKAWFKQVEDARACNVMLGRMAGGLKALAARESLPFCDVLTPMLDVQERAKKADPAFTLAPDGIHPNALGNTLMAYGILKGLQVTNPPATLTIDAAHGTVMADRCTASNLHITTETVSFTRTDLAFPVYLPTQTECLVSYLPLHEELNPSRFTVSGLTPGSTWRLSVGGTNLADFSSAQLAAGTNLASQAGPWKELSERVARMTADQQKLRSARVQFGERMKGWMPPEAKPDLQALLDRVDQAIRDREVARIQTPRAARDWSWTLTRTDSPGERPSAKQEHP